jgi:polyisoprenoid-binding protein YceI
MLFNTLALRAALAALVTTAATLPAHAAPVVYNLDPTHTYPSFEADHLGMSMWRGKFKKSAGKVTLDREAGQGTLEVTVDTASIDFGLEMMNTAARGAEFFDVKKYPKASFKGKLEGFTNGAPSRAVGELTLHGVTKPLTLTLNSFKCMPHPMLKRDWCGADVQAAINREDFGMPMGKEWGIKMDVGLRIQVEAVATK